MLSHNHVNKHSDCAFAHAFVDVSLFADKLVNTDGSIRYEVILEVADRLFTAVCNFNQDKPCNIALDSIMMRDLLKRVITIVPLLFDMFLR